MRTEVNEQNIQPRCRNIYFLLEFSFRIFSTPNQTDKNTFFEAFETAAKLSVKIPLGLLSNRSEFYSNLSLRSRDQNLTQRLTGDLDLPICDDACGEELCDVGFVKVFGNGFALASKMSKKDIEAKRTKFAEKIALMETEQDKNTFKIGKF